MIVSYKTVISSVMPDSYTSFGSWHKKPISYKSKDNFKLKQKSFD